MTTEVRSRRPLPEAPSTGPTDATASSEGGAARVQWGSRLGFVLSAVGSAVGFGSIARFPMNAANNGGAAFVLLYAGIMLLVGVPLMVAEFSLGRTAQRNAVGAFSVLTGERRTRWRYAGLLYVGMAAFFLSWYAGVSGWVLRYAFVSPTGAYFSDPDTYFLQASEGGDALFWHFLVLLLTLAIVTGKISKGIERLNLVLMPTLFLIVIGLAVYALTLDGVAEGYRFYLEPEWSAITLGVVIAAVGQAFFSLSLGQGAMMTYASYLPQRQSLAGNALTVAVSTLTFALVAGFMVFPLLAAFGLLGTGQAGLGLIFGPLPRAFAAMGPTVGPVIGTLFFSAAFFAAFTSAVSLIEPAIAYVSEEFGIDRRRAATLMTLIIYTAGIPVALDTRLLDLEGGVLTDVLVILGGLLIALFVGWRTPARIARARMDSGVGLKLSWYIFPLVRWVLPGALGVLLFFTIAGSPCGLSGGEEAEGLVGVLFGVDGLGCDGT
ncbi:MAG: sodium-dependent transporter [Euryarchaeota archaeon]|nr:sodium-dependent transporter [Euryarchaeota archaeon]